RKNRFAPQESPQIVGEFVCALISSTRIARQTLLANRFQVRRDIRAQRTDRRSLRLRIGQLAHDTCDVAGVRNATGEQFEEDHAQRVNVDGGGELFAALRLFRSHVRERPGDGPGGRCVHVAGETEVGNQRGAVLTQEYVGGLQVAVNQPALVRVV